MAIDFQPIDNSQNTQANSSIDFQPIDNSQQSNPQEQLVDSQSNLNTGLNMPGFTPEQVINQSPEQDATSSPLHFSDAMKMAALSDPDSQQKFLESKFKFAEPILDENGKPTGQFNVGNDPSNLQPLHPGNLGDKAISMLASAAASIPSIAGQIGGSLVGAAAGTLAEGGIPGPGTIIGGIAGAGIGAGLGEAVKNQMVSGEAGYNAQKAAVDNIVTAGFGATGEALGRAVQIGMNKYITPKVGSMIDDALKNNPTGGAVALAKIFKFVANVSPEDTTKAAQIGFGKLSRNTEAWDSQAIHNISDDLSQEYAQRVNLARLSIDSSEKAMKQLDVPIKTTDLLESYTKNLEDAGIITKIEGDGEGISSSFRFNDDAPSAATSQDHIKILKGLGVVQRDYDKGTFDILRPTEDAPMQGTISVARAINTKSNWKDAVLNKDFGDAVSNNLKSAFYGDDEINPLYPNGFKGLRSYINDVAEKEGVGRYVVANKNYENLMNAGKGVIKGPMGKNIPSQGFMDLKNPASISKFLSEYNKLKPFQQEALQNLKKELGTNTLDRAEQWSTVQGINKANPQLLKLSIIGGLASMAIPGAKGLDYVGRASLAFGLANPRVLMHVGQVGEIGSSIGKNVLGGLLKHASSQTGRAVLSNIVKRKVTGQ